MDNYQIVRSRSLRLIALLLFLCSVSVSALADMAAAGDCEEHHGHTSVNQDEVPTSPDLTSECCEAVLCPSCPSGLSPLAHDVEFASNLGIAVRAEGSSAPKLMQFPPFRPPRA